MANASPIFDPNSEADSAKTFLMFVESGDIPMMKLELKSNPALANAKDKHGTPMLHHAVDWAETAPEAVDLLLEKGADPRIPDERGVTADRLATQLGFTTIAEKIKKLAVKLDMADKTSALRHEFENVIQGFSRGTGRDVIAASRATFPRKNYSRVARIYSPEAHVR